MDKGRRMDQIIVKIMTARPDLLPLLAKMLHVDSVKSLTVAGKELAETYPSPWDSGNASSDK